MAWLRRRWFTGVLAAAPLLALIPSLMLVRPASPPTQAPLAQASETPTPLPTPAPTATASPTATPQPPPPTPPPGLRAAGEAAYVPILMYHYIREVDAEADPLGFRLSVRPDRLAEQLGWLREQGYETVLMHELAACLRGAMLCPERAVALTFDDGYADNALVALPLLRRHGLRATFFIVTGLVGREGYMSWRQLEQLRDAGMEIGAHTVTHADLAAIEPDDARWEIAMSRATLQRRLGVEVRSLSYPAGSYTPEIALMARDMGFTSAVTTTPADSMQLLYELPRRRVLGGETIVGYQWYFVPPSQLGE